MGLLYNPWRRGVYYSGYSARLCLEIDELAGGQHYSTGVLYSAQM